MRRLILALTIAGCASQGPPPGGPPDPNPPQIDTTVPASGATGVRPARVIFRFDEVVSEQPRGGSARSLSDLFLISPRQGDPEVDWHRDEIHVRPRRGWRPNTVYTVTLLPGLGDLRGNTRREGATVVFTTGGAIPETRLEGIVFDWTSGRPIAAALVTAIPVDDSTEYLAAADSAGRFTFRHLPQDVYTITGFADANRNRRLDPREMYAAEKVTVQDSAQVELLAFVHDTIGPGIGELIVRDSVTLRLRLDRPIDVGQTIDTSNFVLLAADSSRVPIAEAVLAREFDRVVAELARQRADSARVQVDTARRDTLRAPAAPLPPQVVPPLGVDTLRAAGPSRPSPQSEVVLRLGQPLRPASSYRLRIAGVRGLLGHTRTSDRVFSTPAVRTPAAETPAPATPAPATPSGGAR